jgi:hypothetical protein
MTPTGQAYEALESYIRRHRPDVTVTVTDGIPDQRDATKDMVKKLRKHTRMVAFGISDPSDREAMERKLRGFGYNQSFAVDDIHEIPPKLIKTITG